LDIQTRRAKIAAVRRILVFFVWLLAALVLLTALGFGAIEAGTGAWFGRDTARRSRAALDSVGHAARENVSDPARLSTRLGELAMSARLLGAAVCTPTGQPLGASPGFPSELGCERALERLRTAGVTDDHRELRVELPQGPLLLAAAPIAQGGEALGIGLVLQDIALVQLRAASTHKVLWFVLFVLVLAAAATTLVVARFAWRGWTHELERALSGEGSGEFQPLLRDLRSLLDGVGTREHESASDSRRWDPQRLRSALTKHLRGERVIILANREPWLHQKAQDGGVHVLHPASGLVTALEPVMRACSGVWVAHGSGSADREMVDARGRVRVPPGEESYWLRRVWLSEEEENGYYYGLANEGLWPLCHVAHTRPIFRSEDWEHYVRVNQKFADAVCEEVDSSDPIVLVQDYHFALAPRMIRKRLPRATILTFWHIPWPNPERIGICPWREELIGGLLGSSIVGFHTQQHCNNFMDSVDSFMESRIDRETNTVIQTPLRTLVRPYPISIEWPVHWLANVPPVAECRSSVRQELGLPENTLLGVGIDRLDYTKGIEERLSAVDQVLERHAELRGRFVFAQLAAPSRTKITHYRELAERVDALAARINEKWASGDYRPIVLLRSHYEPPTVFRYYRAAELCYVSSLHDGMNLVAKEFVAAREDEQGVLVLSQFTGAARDLTEALIVNPYDLREASDALAAALRMPIAEQRERMRSMRRHVSEFNVYRWAGRMLVDAAEVRRRERMSGRLAKSSVLRRFKSI
jgi:trehalose 6-phosphate synthase